MSEKSVPCSLSPSFYPLLLGPIFSHTFSPHRPHPRPGTCPPCFKTSPHPRISCAHPASPCSSSCTVRCLQCLYHLLSDCDCPPHPIPFLWRVGTLPLGFVPSGEPRPSCLFSWAPPGGELVRVADWLGEAQGRPSLPAGQVSVATWSLGSEGESWEGNAVLRAHGVSSASELLHVRFPLPGARSCCLSCSLL